jgi:hypothetical protein
MDFNEFGRIFEDNEISDAMGFPQEKIWERYYKFHCHFVYKIEFPHSLIAYEKTISGRLRFLDPSRYTNVFVSSSESILSVSSELKK